MIKNHNTKEKQKHLALLLTIPDKHFAKCATVIRDIKKRFEKGEIIPDSMIAICYYGLGLALSSGNIEYNIPKIEESKDYLHGDCYKYSDTINPDMNLFYTCVYKTNFLLPKVYKNVFYNTTPQTRFVLIHPSKDSSFKEATKLRDEFINIAKDLISWYDVDAYLQGTKKRIFMSKSLKEAYLENCHKALKDLLSTSQLVYNEQTITKGSVILAQELNNLLANQNLIDNKKFARRMGAFHNKKIIADVREHKKAMFGELEHDYAHFKKVKAMWAKKKKITDGIIAHQKSMFIELQKQ